MWIRSHYKIIWKFKIKKIATKFTSFGSLNHGKMWCAAYFLNMVLLGIEPMIKQHFTTVAISNKGEEWHATQFLITVTRPWWKVVHFLSHLSLPQTINHDEILLATVVINTFCSSVGALSELLTFLSENVRIGNYK